MAFAPVFICASTDLQDGGKGIRFPVQTGAHRATGFVVRYKQQVYAYLNRCAHIPTELDWVEGEFFESSGLYLMCATHGAIYAPETGRCEGGPCRGGRLQPIAVQEENGQVFWLPDTTINTTNTTNTTNTITISTI